MSFTFITVGSQKFQFNRLLRAIDDLIQSGILEGDVFAQTGYSTYKPKHYESKPFLDRDEFAIYENKADLIITHGGTGAIISAIKKGKKVIAVARLRQYGEHVDNHQMQLIGQFGEDDLICGISDCDKLPETVEYALSHEFKTYRSDKERIIESIDRYINNVRN